MNELKIIGWLFWLMLSIAIVFHFIGFSGICNMFPEGRRRWHFPVQVLSLMFFAAAVLCNPWSY